MTGDGAEPFTLPMPVRYAEVDQQGVVFNAHYLTWFDEAFTAFMAHCGLPYEALMETGADVMLVRSEIDWRGGVRWRDDIAIAVAAATVGRTSFTLEFEVRRAGEGLVRGRTVYVCVDAQEHRPVAVPEQLREALEAAAPLRPGS